LEVELELVLHHVRAHRNELDTWRVGHRFLVVALQRLERPVTGRDPQLAELVLHRDALADVVVNVRPRVDQLIREELLALVDVVDRLLLEAHNRAVLRDFLLGLFELRAQLADLQRICRCRV
jgi:hypothetical protein